MMRIRDLNTNVVLVKLNGKMRISILGGFTPFAFSLVGNKYRGPEVG